MDLINSFASPLILLVPTKKPIHRLFAATWAALPAFIVSLALAPGITLELPWLVFGTRLGFDETARIFLFFTALLWLVASVYTAGYFSSRSSKTRFFIWFL